VHPKLGARIKNKIRKGENMKDKDWKAIREMGKKEDKML
jgi:hypothetical protein